MQNLAHNAVRADINNCIAAVCCLTTSHGVLLAPTFLVEQNGGDQDGHLNHNGYEKLQRLMESDDLQESSTSM